MTDDTPTTSETILASANAETDPTAPSSAADFPDFAPQDALRRSALRAENTSLEAPNDHETRLQRLEDDIAFLRKQFGWPGV